jgi:hypothetical protein
MQANFYIKTFEKLFFYRQDKILYFGQNIKMQSEAIFSLSVKWQ